MEIFNFGIGLTIFFLEKNVKKRQNGPKSIFLEVEGLSKAEKVTLPPILGSRNTKTHFGAPKTPFCT